MKILLVDDDEVMRKYLHRVLDQDASLTITEAADGQVAWEMLQQNPLPDLCLLDIMMPNMNGLELLEKMRSDDRYQRVKVIMCTVVRDPNHVQQAITLDVSDYILKPFKNLTLINMVRRALGLTTQLPPETGRERSTTSVVEESYASRLDTFLKTAGTYLGEIETLIAQDRRQSVLESLNNFRKDCRFVGLGAMEQALSALESSFVDRDKREIQARLQTLHSMHRGIAEVFTKISSHLERDVETKTIA